MTLAIVVTLIVLILMTLAIFFLLKYEVKKMNEKAKVYFTLKTQEYTSDVLEKEWMASIEQDMIDIIYGVNLSKEDRILSFNNKINLKLQSYITYVINNTIKG